MFGRYALSFKTKKGLNMYYLVPNDDKKQIELKETTVPDYAFTIDGLYSDSPSGNQQTKCCSMQ